MKVIRSLILIVMFFLIVTSTSLAVESSKYLNVAQVQQMESLWC